MPSLTSTSLNSLSSSLPPVHSRTSILLPKCLRPYPRLFTPLIFTSDMLTPLLPSVYSLYLTPEMLILLPSSFYSFILTLDMLAPLLPPSYSFRFTPYSFTQLLSSLLGS